MSTSPLVLYQALTVTLMRGINGDLCGYTAIADGGQTPDTREILALLQQAMTHLEGSNKEHLPDETL